MKYYHITDFQGFLTIKKNGIKANADGEIFLFDTDVDTVISYAARNQLGLDDYGLFEIDGKGITGKMENDNVAEITAIHQFIVYQPLIRPKFLRFRGMFKILD